MDITRALLAFHIDFDGQQLTIKTDVPEICAFLERTYSAMLVSESNVPVGLLELLRTDDGYEIRGARPVRISGRPEALFDLLKQEVILHFVASRPDLLWLHAGAVEKDGSCIVIAAPSGSGKSTIVTRLCERGWNLFSDDVSPVRMDADQVLPFPQSPQRRRHPGREVAGHEIANLDRELVPVEPRSIGRHPSRVRALVFPRYRAGSAAELATVLPGDAALEILRNCMNFVDHKAAAVARVSEMATRLSVYSLAYSSGSAAAVALDEIT